MRNGWSATSRSGRAMSWMPLGEQRLISASATSEPWWLGSSTFRKFSTSPMGNNPDGRNASATAANCHRETEKTARARPPDPPFRHSIDPFRFSEAKGPRGKPRPCHARGSGRSGDRPPTSWRRKLTEDTESSVNASPNAASIFSGRPDGPTSSLPRRTFSDRPPQPPAPNAVKGAGRS